MILRTTTYKNCRVVIEQALGRNSYPICTIRHNNGNFIQHEALSVADIDKWLVEYQMEYPFEAN